MKTENEKKDLIFTNFPFWIFPVFLVILPFQAFLQTWIRFGFNLSANQIFYAALWKEYLIGSLLIIAAYKIFKEKKFPFKILSIDKVIILFFILALFYFLFFSGTIIQKFAGARYNLEFFLIYFLARTFKFPRKQVKALIILFLAVSLPVIFFGLLQIILPPSFLLKFGYSPNLAEYFKTGIIPTYEAIDPALPNFHRIQSFFPGALQFSSYLILVLSFILSFFLFAKKKSRIYFFLFFTLGLAVLVATYTRSAWIGIIAGIFVMLLLYARKKIYVILPSVLFILAGILLVIFLFKNQTVQTLLLHGKIIEGDLPSSTLTHKTALIEGVNSVLKQPLGKGLGAAGPASKISENAVIPENWYLQIAMEMGIAGLIIFFSAIYLSFKNLYLIFKKSEDMFYRTLSLGLIGALVGISSSSLFLHTWADTAIVYPFWLFTGLIITAFERDLIFEKV